MLGQALMLSILTVIVVMIVQAPEDSVRFSLLSGAFLIAGVASFWSVLALSIKRLHDIGWSVGLIICLFLPPIAMVSILILAVMPGSQATNQHGPPPFPENR
ncbi:MAG: DUF805 domain-containing protein [Rhizobiaceae bacterium]|nr:DUF805 domain-containing protein [Rhizobiaceae bacterium]